MSKTEDDVLILHYKHGLCNATIAERLGIDEYEVKGIVMDSWKGSTSKWRPNDER